MPVLGLGGAHLVDAMGEIALQILSSGASLAYCGDLRRHGLTELLFELLGRYRGHPRHSGEVAVASYLAWPVHMRMPADELDRLSSAHEGVARLVLLRLDGARLEPGQRQGLPAHEPDGREWREGLTAMRRVMSEETDARIVLGGGVESRRGRLPGMAEEVLLSLEAGQPVFLLGGFGGCSRDIAEALGLVEPWPGSRPRWSGLSRFDGCSAKDLRNGLSGGENAILACTPHINQALTLVSRGLRRSLMAG